MSYDDFRITEADFEGKRVEDLPKRPTDSIRSAEGGLTWKELQRWFDELVRVVAAFHNLLVDQTETVDVRLTDIAADEVAADALDGKDFSPEHVQGKLELLRDRVQALVEWAEALDAAEVPAEALVHSDNSARNVQAKLEWLFTQIQKMVLDEIPDGSITPAKLSEKYLAATNAYLDKGASLQGVSFDGIFVNLVRWIVNNDSLCLVGAPGVQYLGDMVLGVGENGKAYVTDTYSNLRKYQLWYSGNQGAGTGMDADLLDGLEGEAYLRKAGGTVDGLMRFEGGLMAEPTLLWSGAWTPDNGVVKNKVPGLRDFSLFAVTMAGNGTPVIGLLPTSTWGFLRCIGTNWSSNNQQVVGVTLTITDDINGEEGPFLGLIQAGYLGHLFNGNHGSGVTEGTVSGIYGLL